MDWSIQDIGALGEFIAAVAVVISLIYVGIQLQQTARLAGLQGSDERRRGWTEFGRLLLNNPDFQAVFNRGRDDLGSLSDDERQMFDHIMREYISNLLGMYIRSQLLPSTTPETAGLRRTVEHAFDAWPGFAVWWSTNKVTYGAELQDFMDQISSEVAGPHGRG